MGHLCSSVTVLRRQALQKMWPQLVDTTWQPRCSKVLTVSMHIGQRTKFFVGARGCVALDRYCEGVSEQEGREECEGLLQGMIGTITALLLTILQGGLQPQMNGYVYNVLF